MSFIETLDNLALKKSELVQRFEHLIAPKLDQELEAMAQFSRSLTLQNFGRTMRLFAPLYLSNEFGSRETEDYVSIVEAGAEGLVVYQETYNRGVYAEMHTAGPKRDFNFRLDCAERGYAAGFRRLGVGALVGLTRWQDEAIALAAHLEHLFK